MTGPRICACTRWATHRAPMASEWQCRRCYEATMARKATEKAIEGPSRVAVGGRGHE
jgi:hypothetical protein